MVLRKKKFANRINPIPDQPDPIPNQNVEGSSDHHDDCEKNPIPDRARRAVDPATFIEVTPDDREKFTKNLTE